MMKGDRQLGLWQQSVSSPKLGKQSDGLSHWSSKGTHQLRQSQLDLTSSLPPGLGGLERGRLPGRVTLVWKVSEPADKVVTEGVLGQNTALWPSEVKSGGAGEPFPASGCLGVSPTFAWTPWPTCAADVSWKPPRGPAHPSSPSDAAIP